MNPNRTEWLSRACQLPFVVSVVYSYIAHSGIVKQSSFTEEAGTNTVVSFCTDNMETSLHYSIVKRPILPIELYRESHQGLKESTWHSQAVA